MTIPYKLWGKLTDSLCDFRTNPCNETYVELARLEKVCNWPFNSSSEQRVEWQNICDRTRNEFERKMNQVKS